MPGFRKVVLKVEVELDRKERGIDDLDDALDGNEVREDPDCDCDRNRLRSGGLLSENRRCKGSDECRSRNNLRHSLSTSWYESFPASAVSKSCLRIGSRPKRSRRNHPSSPSGISMPSRRISPTRDRKRVQKVLMRSLGCLFNS